MTTKATTRRMNRSSRNPVSVARMPTPVQRTAGSAAAATGGRLTTCRVGPGPADGRPQPGQRPLGPERLERLEQRRARPGGR